MGNLSLPGNPRYQPKDLQSVLGYDNLFRAVAEVEIATMKTLADIGIIPAADIASLTSAVEQELFAIPTSEVDDVERKVTRHDIRAWVRIAQSKVDPGLRRWISCSAHKLRCARHRPRSAVRARTRSGEATYRQGGWSLRRASQFIRASASDRPNTRTARAAHHCRLLVRNDPQPDSHQHPKCQQCCGKVGGKNLWRCRRLQRSSGSRHCSSLR